MTNDFFFFLFSLFSLQTPNFASNLFSLQAGESNGLFKKTIEKLSTEYRIQFVWPSVRRAITGGSAADVADPPRKSISMGAIKSAQTYNIPTVHKKRTTNEKEGARHIAFRILKQTIFNKKKKYYSLQKLFKKTPKKYTNSLSHRSHILPFLV